MKKDHTDLIQRFLSGEEFAFATLMGKHRERLLKGVALLKILTSRYNMIYQDRTCRLKSRLEGNKK